MIWVRDSVGRRIRARSNTSRKIRNSGHVHNPTCIPHATTPFSFGSSETPSEARVGWSSSVVYASKPPPPGPNLNPRHPDSLRHRRPASKLSPRTSASDRRLPFDALTKALELGDSLLVLSALTTADGSGSSEAQAKKLVGRSHYCWRIPSFLARASKSSRQGLPQIRFWSRGVEFKWWHGWSWNRNPLFSAYSLSFYRLLEKRKPNFSFIYLRRIIFLLSSRMTTQGCFDSIHIINTIVLVPSASAGEQDSLLTWDTWADLEA
jgi:hypothetical protein